MSARHRSARRGSRRRPALTSLGAASALTVAAVTFGSVVTGAGQSAVLADATTVAGTPVTSHTAPLISRNEGQRAEPTTAAAPSVVPGARIAARLKVVPASAPIRPKPVAPPEPAGGPFSFTLGSFNVLGSQHTGPRGTRHNFPEAGWRASQTVGLMRNHGVDILGTQELQADQLRILTGATGMAAYPGFAWGENDTEHSILYDAGKFEFVSGSSFNINFMGRYKPQPILRLRDRASGSEFYVINTHPSPGGGAYLSQRRAAQAITVGVIRELKATGLPVFVTGDMNDREPFYCNVVAPAGIQAANGGSYSGGCRPPASPLPVDWVAGSGGSFSNYRRDTTPISRRISDHFFISARVSVG